MMATMVKERKPKAAVSLSLAELPRELGFLWT